MPRILVIEDNPASLSLMTYLLQAFGHTPFAASDGEEGIEVARRERPDLILCDVQLPKLDGHKVCRQLKDDPATCQIPLVAVTAYAMVGDREKLLAEGFDDYLSKPINPETFLDHLASYLTKTQMQAHGPSIPSESPPVSQDRATILVVDNSPVNISLSRSVLEPFGYEIVGAGGVMEALDILRRDPPDMIMSDVHMPKPDGYDFIRAVKADPKLRRIPFVFISSTLWGERERVMGLSLGADRFILRPIDPRELVSEIESCLQQANNA